MLGLGSWLVSEMRTPGAVWYMAVDNHVLNVAGARHFPDEDVPLGAGQFLTVALLGAAPWSLAAAVTVAHLVRRRAWRDPAEMPWCALALWTVGVLGLTALSTFRLPHYGLPAYPALALLAARAWAGPDVRALIVLHAALFAALAAVCGSLWASDGATFMRTVIGATDVATRKTAAAGQAPPFPSWETVQPLLGVAAAAFAAGALLAVVAFALRGPRQNVVAMGVVAATMLAIVPAVGSAVTAIAHHRAVRDVAAMVRAHGTVEDVVAHEGSIEASGAFEWYSGRRLVIVNGRRSVLGFGATRDDVRGVFWDTDRLRAAWQDRRRLYLNAAAGSAAR